MAREYSKPIKNAVENFLKEDDWNYEMVDDGVFRTGVKLECKLKSARIYILVYDADFTVTAIIPIGTDEKSMPAMAEFIARVNFGLRIGQFVMNFDDGKVYYRSSMYCGDVPPAKEQIKHLLYVTVAMMDRYGDALAKVIYGFTNPREAVTEAEK